MRNENENKISHVDTLFGRIWNGIQSFCPCVRDSSGARIRPSYWLRRWRPALSVITATRAVRRRSTAQRRSRLNTVNRVSADASRLPWSVSSRPRRQTSRTAVIKVDEQRSDSLQTMCCYVRCLFRTSLCQIRTNRQNGTIKNKNRKVFSLKTE